MADTSSLLQPGETLGDVVTRPVASHAPTQFADPNAGLLRAGETLGPAVQDTTPPPSSQPPGFIQRAYETGPIGMAAEPAKSIYQHRADELTQAMQHLKNGDIGKAVNTAVKLIPFVDPKSPELDIINKIATMPIDEYKKAAEAQRKGDTTGMNVHLASAALPPFAGSIQTGAEDIKNKNWSGLAGDVAGAAQNALLLRRGISEEAPAVEKPGLIDRATGTASDLYDQATGAVSDAGKAAARKAGEVAVAGAIQFGKGAVDAISGRISDALSNAIKSVTEKPSPEQAAASLHDLRANVSDALSGTGLPPEVVNDILNKTVTEYYINTHSVAGGAPEGAAAAVPAPEGEVIRPTPNYQALRDLGYTDSQVNKMTPEAEVNALNGPPQGIVAQAKNFAQEVINAVDRPEGFSAENYLKAQAAKGAFRGAAAGGLAGTIVGHPLEGTAGGLLGGAAYGIGTPLAKAAIKVLTDDYGLGLSEATAKVSQYYQRASQSAVGTALSGALDRYNALQVNMGAAGVVAGAYVGQAIRRATGTIADAFNKAVDAATQQGGAVLGQTAATAVNHMAELRDTVRASLSNVKGMTADAINSVVDRVMDEYHARVMKSVSGGAPGPIEDATTFVNKAIHNALQKIIPPSERQNPSAVAIRNAAAIDPLIRDRATPAQMGQSSPAIENALRKTAGPGQYVATKIDEPARLASEQSANTAIRDINPTTTNVELDDAVMYLAHRMGIDEHFAGVPGEAGISPHVAVFDALDKMSPTHFTYYVDGLDAAQQGIVRQGFAQHLLDKSLDPETGMPNFAAMRKAVTQAGEAKLGPDFTKFDTLSKGWAELEKSRAMTNNKGVSLLTKVGGGLILGAMDIMISNADPVGVLAMAGMEYAGLKYLGPALVDFFMKPRNVNDINWVLRMSNRIPDEQMQNFTRKVVTVTNNLKTQLASSVSKFANPAKPNPAPGAANTNDPAFTK